VRRSAEISLSNLSDDRLRHAKSGDWWKTTPHRRLSNNSAVYTEKPEIGLFMREWLSLFESKSGERGIFNRDAAKRKCEEIGRNPEFEWGTNPCGEIILRPRQLCNLTEVIIRPDDKETDLKEKVIIATILGTFQSSLTKFPYVSNQWVKNCEEERLLGVSLTGIMDNKLTNGKGKDLANLLEGLRKIVRDTNKTMAKSLGINASAALTCLKPSGTVSQLTNTASGIHPRHSSYYIRTVLQDLKDPLTALMIEQGLPAEPEINSPGSTVAFSFPIKSPEKCITRNELTAIEHLELYKAYRQHWCDHNPSTTISIRDHEWLQVGNWVYDNFDELGGTAFLPFTEHLYRQAPYQEINEDEYKNLMKKVPLKVDWSLLKNYENEDNTTGNQQLACGSPVACEV
jgi:ribonucleoside-diphosphate reductase alpha chain